MHTPLAPADPLLPLPSRAVTEGHRSLRADVQAWRMKRVLRSAVTAMGLCASACVLFACSVV